MQRLSTSKDNTLLYYFLQSIMYYVIIDKEWKPVQFKDWTVIVYPSFEEAVDDQVEWDQIVKYKEWDYEKVSIGM